MAKLNIDFDDELKKKLNMKVAELGTTQKEYVSDLVIEELKCSRAELEAENTELSNQAHNLEVRLQENSDENTELTKDYEKEVCELKKITLHAKTLVGKFINKVESGRARSKETYADCKDLLNIIENYKKDGE